MLLCNHKGNKVMETKETQNFSIRLKMSLISKLDEIGKTHDWSRNKVISKILTENIYKLSGDSA